MKSGVVVWVWVELWSGRVWLVVEWCDQWSDMAWLRGMIWCLVGEDREINLVREVE